MDLEYFPKICVFKFLSLARCYWEVVLTRKWGSAGEHCERAWEGDNDSLYALLPSLLFPGHKVNTPLCCHRFKAIRSTGCGQKYFRLWAQTKILFCINWFCQVFGIARENHLIHAALKHCLRHQGKCWFMAGTASDTQGCGERGFLSQRSRKGVNSNIFTKSEWRIPFHIQQKWKGTF